MFDSHAHVAFKQFDGDRGQVVERSRAAGVAGWIEIGSNVGSSKRAIALAKEIEGVQAAVGVHPDDVSGLDEAGWQELEELTQDEKVVAIGEIGFDYYRGGSYEEQLGTIERFVALAGKYDKPIVWHVRSSEERDAHEDLLAYLQGLDEGRRPKGVSHTFSGTVEQAKQYVDLGLYIGISGIVTFKNAGELVEVVKAIPLDRLLVETDCPYLAPEPHRGQRNEPAYVKYMAEKVAELKGVDVSEVERVTDRNVEELFGV